MYRNGDNRVEKELNIYEAPSFSICCGSGVDGERGVTIANIEHTIAERSEQAKSSAED